MSKRASTKRIAAASELYELQLEASNGLIAADNRLNGRKRELSSIGDIHQINPTETYTPTLEQIKKSPGYLSLVSDRSNLARQATRDTNITGGGSGLRDKGKKNKHERQQSTISDCWIHSTQATLLFGFIICVNAVVIGLETDLAPKTFSWGWYITENVFIVVFSIEMILRFMADRWNTFADGWNVFDMLLITGAIIDTWILTWTIRASSDSDSYLSIVTVLRVVRLLRLARVFRLFRVFKELFVLIRGLVNAARALSWVAFLLIIFIYVCAIFVTRVVGQQSVAFEEAQDDVNLWFGSMGKSMLTLFQLMTLEGWPDIGRALIMKRPETALFFVFYILGTQYCLLNLVTGIIVENFMETARSQNTQLLRQIELEKLSAIDELSAIYVFANARNDNEMTPDEFAEALHCETVVKRLQSMDIAVIDANDLFCVLDVSANGTLSLEEFLEGMLRIKGSAKSTHLLNVQHDLHKVARNLNYKLRSMEARDDTRWKVFTEEMIKRIGAIERSLQLRRFEGDSTADNDDDMSEAPVPVSFAPAAPIGRKPIKYLEGVIKNKANSMGLEPIDQETKRPRNDSIPKASSVGGSSAGSLNAIQPGAQGLDDGQR